MEEVEAALLEGGIEWLAQTIQENLLSDKLDEWIRQVELAGDTEKLRSEIERVEIVVSAVKGRAIGNRMLARSLGRLRELLYDADDAVDELDYYRLQQEVQGATWHEPEGTAGDGAEQAERPTSNAGIAGTSASKRRSMAWGHFVVTEKEKEKEKPVKAKCIHCDTEVKCGSDKGTSVLHNHLKSESCRRKRGESNQQLNPSSAGEGAPDGNSSAATGNSVGRKRMRIDGASTDHVAANTHPWNKAELSNRFQQMTHQLEEATNEVLRLRGLDNFACSNLHLNNTSDSCLRTSTSSLVQRKIYGRVEEKNSVIKLMTKNDSDSLTVLPIVGIGGIGKTGLAQLVYNDLIVKRHFQHRIWVCVSINFDEVRLTREMLEFVCEEKHEGLCSFAKLQESLMSNIKSKRFLLVFDDVWDDMDVFRWNKLLSPLRSNNAKGNVILVTTRSMSVAKRIGTVEANKLGALEKEYFWLLFIECAFGDEKYEAHKFLSTIAKQIAGKLKGNPLAAETAGELLRKHHTIDHWNNILRNDDWKSLQLSGGIMPSLKLSYDQLPSHLQQCFMYCSIFPNNYHFVGEELVRIWTSQGFLKCSHSNKRLEEIGQEYLTDLVNLGFFEQVEREESTLGDQTSYAVCGLMHDFARMVSRTEYATAIIDGQQCNKMAPTIRHLSILTDSAYHGDPRSEKFEKIIRNAVLPVRKLRTLVLTGKYALIFFQSIKYIVQDAQNLRFLQISSTYTDLNPLTCNMVNPTHIRYIKLDNGALPQSLRKFYHLQVLDAGSEFDLIIPNGMEHECSSIASIGGMTSLQEHDVSAQNSSGLDIAQLESMDELIQLAVRQHENVTSRDEASVRTLGDLDMVQVSRNATLPQDECDNVSELLEGPGPLKNLKHLLISQYDGATSPSWLVTSLTALHTLRLESCGQWKILPSLERLLFLRKLELRNMQEVVEISIPLLEELMLIEMPMLERCSCTSMRDLSSTLRVLKIEECPVLKIFPLFENCQQSKIKLTSWLPRLCKLTIHYCPHLLVHNPLPPSPIVSELSIAGVSTLPTIKGSSSERLTIESDGDMPTMLDDKVLSFHNLRFLTGLVIQGQNLTFSSFEGFRQLNCLKSLAIRYCKYLDSSPVQQEPTREKMAAANSNKLPSLERFDIEYCAITGKWLSVMLKHVQALQELSLHGCKDITRLSIGEEENSQPNLMSAPEAWSLGYTGDTLTSSARDGLLRIPLNLLSSLKNVSIIRCSRLTFYGSEEGFAGLTSLEKLKIVECPDLVHNYRNDEQANGRWLLPPSLVELEIPDDYLLERLQPCFPGNLTRLKKLKVGICESLISLQLHSCTALQELIIENCESFNSLEGLQSLGSLRLLPAPEDSSLGYPGDVLTSSARDKLLRIPLNLLSSLKNVSIINCFGLTFYGSEGGFAGLTSLEKLKIESCPELLSSLVHNDRNDEQANGRWLLPPSLVELEITDEFLEKLQPCFPGNLTRLKKLEVGVCQSLISLQLHSCTALQELIIEECMSFNSLEGLQSLRGLTHLKIYTCPGLLAYLESLFGQGYELCPQLERLKINDTSILTTPFCKHLTSLKYLELRRWGVAFTSLQESALQLLTSLQELRFVSCDFLPAGLHSLPSLKRLVIRSCWLIMRLPEEGLPPSLEELDISHCSEELHDQCRALASKMMVKIDGEYVN